MAVAMLVSVIVSRRWGVGVSVTSKQGEREDRDTGE